MDTEVAKKLFTVDEYYRMGEAGIFHPEARLELLEPAQAEEGVADDEQRPALPDEVEGLGDGAVLLVRPGGHRPL